MKPIHSNSQRDKAASALIDQMTAALESATVAVENANRRVCEELSARGGSARRSAIISDVEREIAENPGWLDEVVEIMTSQGKEKDAPDSFHSDV